MSGQQKQLQANPSLYLQVSREDILILMVAIGSSPLKVHRKVGYLLERLAELDKADEWKHSVLNKDEDRALRYWYLTRGCSHELNEDNWKDLRKELASRQYGIDLSNIERSKVFRFANQTVVVRPSRRKAIEEGKDGRRAKGTTTSKAPKLTAAQLEARLRELLA